MKHTVILATAMVMLALPQVPAASTMMAIAENTPRVDVTPCATATSFIDLLPPPHRRIARLQLLRAAISRGWPTGDLTLVAPCVSAPRLRTLLATFDLNGDGRLDDVE